MDLLKSAINHFRHMFYLVLPHETMYPTLDAVPPLVDEAMPLFTAMILIEIIYCWRKGFLNKAYNLNDSMVSAGSGFSQVAMTILFKAAGLSLYCWVHENYAIYKLPWDSVWTWIISFVAVDFAYYWFHRAAHEINILWAFHQMHHSSEYYNLTTALRQSMFQQYTQIFFYLPEALFVPPQVHLTHYFLNLLYGFWVHTPVIGSLGVLDKILSTPADHRVHHGRNRYCIDKNYGGVFIIWDRMFGTFQQELESEPIAYGLVSVVNSFDAFYLQLFDLKAALWDKPLSMSGLGNKLKAMFYGPGWYPGTGRCGDLNDIPEIDHSIKPYDSGVQPWVSRYALVQGLLLVLGYQFVVARMTMLSLTTRIMIALTIILSVGVFGYLLEKRKFAPFLEFIRCIFLYFYICPIIWTPDTVGFTVARIVLLVSAAMWLPFVMANIPWKTAKAHLDSAADPLKSE